MQFDQNHLLEAFQASMSNNQALINQATLFLSKASEQKFYLPSLLLILVNKDVDLHIRQAAAVQLYKTVREKWKVKNDTSLIHNEDRETLKQNILDALIKLTLDLNIQPILSVQLELTILHVATHDFPTNWTYIFSSIIDKLKSSSDFTVIMGSLYALLNLVRAFEYQLEEARKPLDEIVNAGFSTLEAFGQQLLSHYDEIPAAKAMRLILKIFFAAINLELPHYFKIEQNLEKWLTFLKAICDSPVPADAESEPKSDEEVRLREKVVYWSNKKWCGEILNRFMQKYGNPKAVAATEIEFARTLQSKYLILFLETFVKALLRRKTHFVANKYTYFASQFVYHAIKHEEIFNRLNPLLEELLMDVYFPMVFLTQKDIQIWKSDPVEYIRKQEDQSNTHMDIKREGLDCIAHICKKLAPDGKRYLFKFMEFIAYILANGVNPRTNAKTDLVWKQAILQCINILEGQISKIDLIQSQMETLLEQYVIPEFKNEIGFLRAAACQLFGVYGQVEFKKPENVQAATEGIYKCLLDSELPVRVYAAQSLQYLLDQEIAENLLRPHIQDIIKIFVKLMDEIDNEEIVTSLEGVVACYQNEVTPFALDLILKLADSFFVYVHNDDEDNDEAELAAGGCLGTIKRILGSKLSQEGYHKALDILLPLFNYCFSEKAGDTFIEEGMGCFNCILTNMNELSEKIWHYYLVFNYIIAGKPKNIPINIDLSSLPEEKKLIYEENDSGWGPEHIEHMIGALQNYVYKGKGLLLQAKDPGFGLTYLELLFKSIERVYEVNKEDGDDVHVTIASTLFIAILENCVGLIDNIVPLIMEKCVFLLNSKFQENTFKKVLVQTFAMGLWYNPTITLAFFESKGYTQLVFKTIMQMLPSMKSDFEKKRMIFGLSSILKLNPYQIPQLIQQNFTQFFKELIVLTTQALELREKDDDSDQGGEDIEADQDEVQTNSKSPFVDKETFKTSGMAQKKLAEEDDDDEDDEDYEWSDSADLYYKSPLEDECEVLYMRSCMEIMQKSFPNEYVQLVNGLSSEEQAKLKANFDLAEQQKIDFLKQQQEQLEKQQQQQNKFTSF